MYETLALKDFSLSSIFARFWNLQKHLTVQEILRFLLISGIHKIVYFPC
jgi:hypothetical protein